MNVIRHVLPSLVDEGPRDAAGLGSRRSTGRSCSGKTVGSNRSRVGRASSIFVMATAAEVGYHQTNRTAFAAKPLSIWFDNMAPRDSAAILAFLVGSLITLSSGIAPLACNAEADDSSPQPLGVRTLRGTEYSEAVAARNRADRMRAGLEAEMSAARLAWRKTGKPGPSPIPAKFETRAAAVARAYEEVIERFPRTEIAAYCVLRLAGHYQYQGNFDQAARLAAKTACESAGTQAGVQAVLETGLLHLQARHDPAEAAKWFARVPKPEKPAGAEYGTADKLYISARQQLIKCHLRLGQDRQAEDRVKKLVQAYPMYASDLERSYKFEIEASAGTKVKPAPRPPEAKATDSEFTVESYDKALREYTALARRAGQSPSAVLASAVDQLRRVKPGGAESNKAVASLIGMGDAAVAEIGRQLADRQNDFGLQHRSVRVLKGVNSEKSRALLRDMALREVRTANPNIEGWAGRNLIALDRDEAWPLLAATTHHVLGDALNAVDGEPIDEKYMPFLRARLDHENEFVRWRVVEVMASEPSGKYATEVIEAVHKALLSVADLPDVDEPYRSFLSTALTLGEACYARYVNVLARVKVKNDALQTLAGRIEGRGRDVVVLALARRRDASVHDELVRLAQDPKAGLFRAWAATALGAVGTRKDLTLLRRLATSDTLVREGPLPPPHPTDSTGPTHPVRLAAQRAIRMIEKQPR